MSSLRPETAPDFLLSRPHGSVRTQGALATFSSPEEAARALNTGKAEMVVGALPFDSNQPAALTVPRKIVREPGSLNPHDFYLSGEGSRLSARIDNLTPSEDVHLQRINNALEILRQGQLDKVVLARAVDIHFDPPVDPRLVAARLIDRSINRDGFIADLSPAGREGHMLVGSSKEVLVRRKGKKVTAYPLAGSAPRHHHPAIDEEIGLSLSQSEKDRQEHFYVVDHLRQALETVCSEIHIPDQPELTSTKEMWHLATPITGILASPTTTALDLALLTYPTPAVGGTPSQAAKDYILSTEEDRGFYAGAVGWTDHTGDGEYMVAIRCAEVNATGTHARAWAGGGIVAASDARAELEETSAKLRTILASLDL